MSSFIWVSSINNWSRRLITAFYLSSTLLTIFFWLACEFSVCIAHLQSASIIFQKKKIPSIRLSCTYVGFWQQTIPYFGNYRKCKWRNSDFIESSLLLLRRHFVYFFLKAYEVRSFSSTPLKYSYDLFLSPDVFINCWNFVYIFPFFKSGNKNYAKNIKPITKLNFPNPLLFFLLINYFRVFIKYSNIFFEQLI